MLENTQEVTHIPTVLPGGLQQEGISGLQMNRDGSASYTKASMSKSVVQGE